MEFEPESSLFDHLHIILDAAAELAQVWQIASVSVPDLVRTIESD